MFSCRVKEINVKRKLYEGVIVPTALYGAEKWNMTVVEKKRLNEMEMCLRSMCGERVRNEVCVIRELAGRAEQDVLKCFGHMERMEED